MSGECDKCGEHTLDCECQLPICGVCTHHMSECLCITYQYDDAFKEDLIHRLYHVVEELKKLNEILERKL